MLVRGVEFGGDGPVALLLIDPVGQQRSLGAAVADAAGEFSVPVVVPADVVPGPSTVRAIAPDGDPVDARIAIEAAPLGGGDQPGQDEPMLAPGPVTSDGVSASGRDVSGSLPVTAADGLGSASTSTALDPYPLLALLIAAAAVGLLVTRTRHPAPPR